MAHIGIFLADGFEEIEALTVVDLCRRAGIQTDMVSIQEGREVKGSHKIAVQADKTFEDVDFEALDMIVLPGGMPGTKHLEAHEGLMAQVDGFFQAGKCLSAICAAPSILGHRGILKGRKACCYPGFEEALTGAEVVYEETVTDGAITTARGMGCAIAFGLAIVARFCGEEKAALLGENVIYRQ